MIILGSSSPRRKQLLKKLIKNFVIVSPNINEREYHYEASIYAYNLAKLKAYEIFSRYPEDTIISCDTIVLFNNEIINKPVDDLDAKKILKKLSNKKHYVITSYTILNKNIEINRNVKTTVYFNKLDDKLIDEYVSKGYSKGKAGAYGIQDNYPIVNHIEGSYDNVMGFPSEDISKYINFLK